MVLVKKISLLVIIALTCIGFTVRDKVVFASQEPPTPNLFSADKNQAPKANIKIQSPSSSIFSVTRRMFSQNPEPVLAIPIRPTINQTSKTTDSLKKSFYKQPDVEEVENLEFKTAEETNPPEQNLVLGDLLNMANKDETLIKISPMDVFLVDKEEMNFIVINPTSPQHNQNDNIDVADIKEKNNDDENKIVSVNAVTDDKTEEEKIIVVNEKPIKKLEKTTETLASTSIKKIVLPPEIPFFRKHKDVVSAEKTVPVPPIPKSKPNFEVKTAKSFINYDTNSIRVKNDSNNEIKTIKPRTNPIVEVKKEDIRQDVPLPLLPVELVMASRAFNKQPVQENFDEKPFIKSLSETIDPIKQEDLTEPSEIFDSIPQNQNLGTVEKSFIHIVRANEKATPPVIPVKPDESVLKNTPEIKTITAENLSDTKEQIELKSEERIETETKISEKTTSPGIVITPKYPEKEVWTPANNNIQADRSSKWLVATLNKSSDEFENNPKQNTSKSILRKIDDKTVSEWEIIKEPIAEEQNPAKPLKFTALKNANVEFAIIEKDKTDVYGQRLERIEASAPKIEPSNYQNPKNINEDNNINHYRNYSGETLLANAPADSFDEKTRSQPLLTPTGDSNLQNNSGVVNNDASKSSSFVDKLASIFGSMPSTEKPKILTETTSQSLNEDIKTSNFASSFEPALSSNSKQETIQKIVPSEIRISFTADKAEISGQTLKWVKSFAEKASGDQYTGVEVRMAIDYSSDLQTKRFMLIQKILKENGVSPEQIVPVFSMRQPNTVVLRNIKVRSQAGFYNPQSSNSGIYYQKW